ncbi:MAG: hypothetical protein JWO12_2854 [Frankiales bacterium]|nr:hypothetical protein [Frankiales bacterium]
MRRHQTTPVLLIGATLVITVVAAVFVVLSGTAPRFSVLRSATQRRHGQPAAGRLRSDEPVPGRGGTSPVDLTTALRGVGQALPDTASVGVMDERTGRAYWFRPRASYDEASVVKLNLAEAVLWEAQRQGRWLTPVEQRLITSMIQHSDNDATSALWRALDFGQALGDYNRLLGLRGTTLDPGGAWGLTRTTVSDQLALLREIRSRTSHLAARSRVYLQNQLADVEEDQRWGVSAGTPPGAHIRLKDGWLPLPTHGWRVNSVGQVLTPDVDYDIAVLTTDNGTEAEGIAAVAAVSRVVYRALSMEGAAVRSTRVR